jgi:hypothetical protein
MGSFDKTLFLPHVLFISPHGTHCNRLQLAAIGCDLQNIDRDANGGVK